VIRSETAGGNDTVCVRMKLQSLIPAMKHTEETDLGSQMARINITAEIAGSSPVFGNVRQTFKTTNVGEH
jgi:hypothetical protein